MIRFEDLVDKVRANTPDADIELLRRAYVFSALEHKGQVRHSGEPYLVHPLEVASLLADMRLDVVAIAAGLLHDVVEDTLTTIGRIEELFGPEVAHVVEGVTKIGAIPFASSEARQAENFRKMLLAMVDDIRVILVKLADRQHNMRTIDHLPEERRRRIAQETLDIYAPIANRLGMSKVKNELEEAAFRALEPTAYETLKAKVEHKRRVTESVIEELKQTITHKLSEAQVPVREIDGRIKRLYSIFLKLKRQKIELEQVYDLVAIRIVTDSVKDTYAALGIIHQTWQPIPGRVKDFIAMQRPNGYQSLHTSVVSDRGLPFEVQIRTIDMHRIAEEGIAAHWKYKEGRVGTKPDEQYFRWLRQLIEWQQEIRDPQEFIQHLKIDLYPEEVYCFTPRGEVKALPRGATPIDFAYAIHTDVGHQCVGARVNGSMVPLRTHLKNGDIVEIMTQPGHKPSRDWLGYATTSRALQKIRHYIQGEEKTRSLELGKRIFEKEARRFDISIEDPDRRGAAQGGARARAAAGRRPHRGDRLRQDLGAAGAVEDRRRRRAAREAARDRSRLDGQAGAPAGTGSHQGQGHRRPAGGPRPLLQPDPRREDRRLHQPRQGRVGPLGVVLERRQPDVRPRPPHRGGVGQRRAGRRRLHRAAGGAGRGQEGHGRRGQRQGRRDEHQHPLDGGDHRGHPRPHRHDRRDQPT